MTSIHLHPFLQTSLLSSAHAKRKRYEFILQVQMIQVTFPFWAYHHTLSPNSWCRYNYLPLLLSFSLSSLPVLSWSSTLIGAYLQTFAPCSLKACKNIFSILPKVWARWQTIATHLQKAVFLEGRLVVVLFSVFPIWKFCMGMFTGNAAVFLYIPYESSIRGCFDGSWLGSRMLLNIVA